VNSAYKLLGLLVWLSHDRRPTNETDTLSDEFHGHQKVVRLYLCFTVIRNTSAQHLLQSFTVDRTITNKSTVWTSLSASRPQHSIALSSLTTSITPQIGLLTRSRWCFNPLTPLLRYRYNTVKHPVPLSDRVKPPFVGHPGTLTISPERVFRWQRTAVFYRRESQSWLRIMFWPHASKSRRRLQSSAANRIYLPAARSAQNWLRANQISCSNPNFCRF